MSRSAARRAADRAATAKARRDRRSPSYNTPAVRAATKTLLDAGRLGLLDCTPPAPSRPAVLPDAWSLQAGDFLVAETPNYGFAVWTVTAIEEDGTVARLAGGARFRPCGTVRLRTLVSDGSWQYAFLAG